MPFRAILAFCLCLGIAANPARADLTDNQPSYTRLAARCGEDPSRPSFTAAEYAAALLDAAKAAKQAKKEGNRARQTAIAQSVAQLKDCQKQEETKFTLPKVTNCREFINSYTAYSARAASLLAAGKISSDDRNRVREMFRVPAETCVRQMMTKCIDPTKTSDVDFVIQAMEAASDFGFIYSSANLSRLDLFFTIDGPGTMRMTFCTETDYACKGDQASCDRRVQHIKAAMQTYLED
jgi:hypothetical protein